MTTTTTRLCTEQRRPAKQWGASVLVTLAGLFVFATVTSPALAVTAQSAPAALAQAAPTEAQVKAVFLFNFTRFVHWPDAAFSAPGQPFVIGVVGDGTLTPQLDDAVTGERVGSHPLEVRQLTDLHELSGCCQIVFIDRSAAGQLGQVLDALDHHGTLTVSDSDAAAEQGVMVQFVTRHRQVHMLINNDSARAAGLTISSSLLRLARLVAPEAGA